MKFIVRAVDTCGQKVAYHAIGATSFAVLIAALDRGFVGVTVRMA